MDEQTINVSVPPEDGQPTSTSYIAVCQCGATKFSVKKRSKTAVTLKCSNCDGQSVIKGNVASIRVRRSEIEYAVKECVISPAVTPEEPAATDKPSTSKPKKEDADKRVSWRFSFTNEQRTVVRRAMEVYRAQYFKKLPELQDQQWQAICVERVFADWLAGANPLAIEVVDAMETEADRQVSQQLELYPNKKFPQRKVRAIKANAREQAAKRLGLWGDETYQASEPTPDEKASQASYDEANAAKKADQAAAAAFFNDEDRLSRSISEGLVEHSDDMAAEGGDRPSFLITRGQAYVQLLKRWRDNPGSVFLKLQGDERTKDGAGRRPTMFFWASEIKQVPDLMEIYRVAYEGVMSSDAIMKIVQYVQPGQSGNGFNETEVLEDE